MPYNIEQEIWVDQGILFEHQIGDPTQWAHDYAKIARSKCYLSWLTGMDTQTLQARATHLLQNDSTIYYGSAVSDGLVVACSRAQSCFDQMISAWVLEACRALCIQARERIGIDGCRGFV